MNTVPAPVLVLGGLALTAWVLPPGWLLASSHPRRDVMLHVWVVLRLRGFSEPVIRAAIANAIGESNLNPDAVGDNGASVGLFQLNDHGAGEGMSTDVRQSATVNTWVIASVAAANPPAVGWGSTDVRALIEWWVRSVERPADPIGATARRIALAQQYLGLA